MDKKYETFVFDEDNYKRPAYSNPHEYEIDEQELFEDISALTRILVKNGYQIKIYREESYITIEYGYQDEDISDARLEWVDNDVCLANL